ncbi:MAG: IS4 family transposase, partial [Cyanobacteria bacterium RI_101]|nr:IS4 family transposase [Cyanobacteria bacterium RI_101]
MNQYSALKQALKPHLGWHGARVSFLALFLLALLKVKTVNLKELAIGFEGSALVDSSYKRLQRFFADFKIDYIQIARIVVSWLNIPQPWILSIDRTNWAFGSCSYNILTIGIVHEGVAIPILWWMLNKKKGNSSSDERMRFMEEMLKIFPSAQIRCLCGDREFIGQAWLRYLLLEPSMAFCLRIRATDKIERYGKLLAANVVFAHLAIGESQRLQGACRVWGYPVSVEAVRLPDNSLLIVIGAPDYQGLIQDYAQRWGIETLFGIFKTRGFCLESTHFTDPKRLRKLFALLTLALAWSLKTGLEIHRLHPIPIKKHGRRAKSLFRLGFDHLRHLILNPSLPNYLDFLHSL